jgi:hypothetical protein
MRPLAAALALLCAPALAQDGALEQLRAAARAAATAVPPGAPRLQGTALGRRLFSHGDPLDVDRDGDGLDDGAEAALAELFRPWLTLDSHEKATRPGEPVTLYQVRPLGCVGPLNACGTRTVRLTVVYASLWALDGGYGPASLFCYDSHAGDNQTVSVTLRSDDDGLSFFPEAAHIGRWTWPTRSGEVQWLDGTHFRLFLSAGKHHHFFDTFLDRRASPHSDWGCTENVDGRGPSFLARLGGNVGEPESHGAPFVGDLSALGFPGEHAWDTRSFCGGLRCDRRSSGTMPMSRAWSRAPFQRMLGRRD